MQSVIQFSHQLLADTLKPGDLAIDATCGNGHDTLKLAQFVGEKGKVYAFDIQEQAIENTRSLVSNANMKQVEIIHDGHQHIEQYLDQQPIAGAIFNLGYLPKADHSITTLPKTTISAVDTILSVLKQNGRVVLVIYHGHPGGADERDQLLSYCQQLDQKNYQVLQYQFINQRNHPPFILAIEKTSTSAS
ncbi:MULTISPECIES: class I SAM-dependent methyltransferase [Gracilibacillus]|uniref:class I SAM-dependent methyltransferase n=1 Tax=Gracilibacillus TaxID=74385 RepID=UPI000824219E|nr:class I SAM-dependent methyltransferase [Gracilibacillus timonensis]